MVPFKIYYGGQIRRLAMGKEGLTYPNLVGRVQAAFGISLSTELQLTWLDSDGDKILFSSDFELWDAINCWEAAGSSDGSVVRVFVTVKSDPSAALQGIQHPGVYCDGCNTDLLGYRFKCLACPDYDLCLTCLKSDTHPQHPMLLIRRPGDAAVENPFAWATAFGGRCGRGFGGGGGRGGGGCWRRRWCHQQQQQPEQPEQPKEPENKPEDEEPKKQQAQQQAQQQQPEGAAAAAASSPMDLDARPPSPKEQQQPEQPQQQEQQQQQQEQQQQQQEQQQQQQEQQQQQQEQEFEFIDPESREARVARALEHMRAMGFTDDAGWLTRLLADKNGDICAVLDAIRPVK